jgi:glycosyltransferase involved in cell wall biosynthesis
LSATVSVVIPVKDDAVLLRRCLDALAEQTVRPLEVVVVDNGSTDDSAAVATAHGAKVVTEPMPGIPAAASTGYDAARGDVIARCDADSLPPPDWVDAILRGLGDGDAVTGSGTFYDLPPVLRRVMRWLYLGTYFTSLHLALGHPVLWGSNMAIRREAWTAVRGRVHRDDPELHDDIDLAFALGPHRLVRHDRRLTVGVSARCLRGGPQLRRRMRRAVRTLRLGWKQQPPWERWQHRLTRRPAR